VQDPDPNAVDGGTVLGLRIEAMTRAKFLRPYYVFLNRPYASAPEHRKLLRVHRHTVPPSIPLAGLAARYLPPPPLSTSTRDGDGGDEVARDGTHGQGTANQDLARFAKALRREIVRYHNRLSAIADLRKTAGLNKKKSAEDQEEPENALLDILPADAEAKQIAIQWSDGRTGRLVMDDDGEVAKLLVFGEKGQDRETARALLGVDEVVRVEEVGRRLSAM
jgi:central kinetochore subunit Mal2/MCM21